MLIWIGFAVVTAAVIFAVTRPLMAADSEAPADGVADLAVYRDQLQEIEGDLERGLISPEEAEGARVELSRRILKRADDDATSSDGTPVEIKQPQNSLRRQIGYATAATIPLISVALYLMVGAPGLPSQPHAERMKGSPEQATVAELIGRIEGQLRQNPDDGRGWEVVAPVYLRLQRYNDAANAYAQAIRTLGENQQRLAGFGEATIFANNGLVTEAARLAFAKILKDDPKHVEARFWLAQAKEQDGKKDAALKDYQDMLASAPDDAPWRPLVEERIAVLSGKPPPALAQNTGEQAEFINQMVEGLAERLKADGSDAVGWKKLIRAYVVLGRTNDAKSALGKAREHFSKDAKELAEFDALADSLGLGS